MASEGAGPLTTLGRLLQAAAPPSLGHLRYWLQGSEGYLDFLALVQEYLPECREEVLAQHGPGAQVTCFARRFGERYFPLPDAFESGWVEEYEELTCRIPLVALGIGYEEYHMLTEWHPGYQLLAALTTDPWDNGARAALLESCAEHVPRELLRRTRQGYPPEALHARLDGTRFEAGALVADWVHRDTGSAFLDLDAEMVGQVDEPWDPETVRVLVQHWQRAREVQDRVHALAEWVMVEPPERFRELLAFIEAP